MYIREKNKMTAIRPFEKSDLVVLVYVHWQFHDGVGEYYPFAGHRDDVTLHPFRKKE